MEVGHRALGIPRIAHPANHLAASNRRALDEIGAQPDAQAVVGVVLIVVEMDVVGLPAVGVPDDGPAAVARPTVLGDTADHSVGDSDNRSESRRRDVVAHVLAGATVTVGAEG